jgi:hypothetical protein
MLLGGAPRPAMAPYGLGKPRKAEFERAPTFHTPPAHAHAHLTIPNAQQAFVMYS